jgi:DNA-binding response OmpR family regulator
MPDLIAPQALNESGPDIEIGVAAPMRVLVVEDNENLAQTTGWLLEAMGFDCRLALTARASLEIAKTYRPQVVLLDIGLPDMNGFDLCRHLRQTPEMTGAIFVARTGWDSQEHREKIREAGFDHLVVKPQVTPLQALLEKLAGTLSRPVS